MKILVVDDESPVREAYRHVLTRQEATPSSNTVSALAEQLFADEAAATPADSPDRNPSFELHFAEQGLDAVALVQEAKDAGAPFKVAFIDIRMPPGIDGRETARRIRAIDADINLVIVTAFSDHSVTDIAAVAGPPDKMFYISKPFSGEEIHQMAIALCRRWDHDTGQLELLREKIAELAMNEARAKHAASHDFLTGAPNRMHFLEELGLRVAQGKSDYALALFDLDRFKHVNDTFGHGAGDDLLIAVYDLLRNNVPDDVLVARLGGDEFGLILPATTPEKAKALCARLVDICCCSFTIFGNSVRIGASCGLLIMETQHKHRDAIDLMRFADLALFAAKREGRRRVCVFDEAMDESQRFRQKIESGLRNAIANNELALHYQPIVERDSMSTVGFEALLRWFSPEHGSVSPSIFVPIAEESSLIDDLGEWVFNQALSDSRDWPDLYVSINFSPRQFKRMNFIEWLDEGVAKWGREPSHVQIEITETAIFEDSERAASVLRQAQERGYRVALDDFGTGYSSLFNIKNFSLDCFKIDKSFIEGLGQDKHSAAIVNSVVHLARALGLSVIAEGVETDVQCHLLRITGCSHLQGYLFGKAEPSAIATERANREREERNASGYRRAAGE